jgi:hypothetical protein
MNEKNESMTHLQSQSGKERTRGTKIRSDALLAFLKGRNASTRVLEAFECIPFPRQIALPDGILFAEREIFRRNEFVNGDFIVIGARRDYAFYVINLRTSSVGVITAHEECDSIPEETVESLGLRLVDFVPAVKQEFSQSKSTYLVPEYFNVDEISVMQALSDCGLGHLAQPPRMFRSWIHNVGVPKPFCFNEIVPTEEIAAGACVIFPYEQIVIANYEVRRRINPQYLVIGSCPDGNLVVLDTRRNALSIGYVSIEEAGDEESWDDYYVYVSQTLGSFLHDSNFLGILPDDYYQAKKLGYRS